MICIFARRASSAGLIPQFVRFFFSGSGEVVVEGYSAIDEIPATVPPPLKNRKGAAAMGWVPKVCQAAVLRDIKATFPGCWTELVLVDVDGARTVKKLPKR